MSRAYRIQVAESVTRTIKGTDGVSTHLEILQVLPPDDMCGLLTAELLQRGYEQREDGTLARQQGDVEIVINPMEGLVTVQISGDREVTVEGEQTGWSYQQNDKKAHEALKDGLKGKLEKQIDAQEAELQEELTGKLEAVLGDVRQELNQVSNQVTAKALKKKAAQMGQIKEVSEDPQSGSMTIVLEV